MEIRKARLIVGSAGGTAAKGAKTYKLSIPTAWIQEMNLSDADRQLELCFEAGQIIVRKAMSLSEFAANGKALGHDMRLLRYYDADILCTAICADFTAHTLRVQNHTTQLIKTAFGKNEFPTWSDLMSFLEERCVPRARAGLRDYLISIGLDEYDPVEIIKKTAGKMAEDTQWIDMETIS